MDAIISLSCLALVWPIVCSSQQSSSVVATLLLPTGIFLDTPTPTALVGAVSTSIGYSDIVTAYTLPCDDEQDLQYCQDDGTFAFSAITGDTTYDLFALGTMVCSFDNGAGPSDICTQTLPDGQTWENGDTAETFSDSSPKTISFASMDEDLAYSLSATTITYGASPTATPSTSSSGATPPTSSTTTSASPSPTSISSTVASTAPPAPALSSSPTSTATGSQGLTEHEKIGVGVGIMVFVLVCCAAGVAVRTYRKKKRAENRNPSELYHSTDEKGQASGT